MDSKKDICKNSNVTIDRQGGQVVMHIIGDFDNSTTPIVHECCKKIQRAADLKKIVLDFDKAARVDTSAFACIINFIKEHIGSGTEIFVSNLHDPEEKLIELLKVEKLIKVI